MQEGHLAGVRIFGDFMGRRDVGELEARLVGLPYTREAVVAALEGVEMSEYFGDVDAEEVVALLVP